MEACQLITSAQVRAARSAIDMTAADLALAVGISRQTVVKIESGNGIPSVNVHTLLSIKAVLEAQGIEFITTPDGSPGIVIRGRPTV